MCTVALSAGLRKRPALASSVLETANSFVSLAEEGHLHPAVNIARDIGTIVLRFAFRIGRAEAQDSLELIVVKGCLT